MGWRSFRSIYLLKQDRVSAFEKDLHVNAQTALPIAPPLDGYVLPLPVSQTVPQWVGVLNSVLQDSTALALTGASPAALMVVRRGPETIVLTFGHAWMKPRTLSTGYAKAPRVRFV